MPTDRSLNEATTRPYDQRVEALVGGTTMVDEQQEFIYCKEHWSGDSRDGVMVRGEGCHFFRMLPQGLILEAYELYESEEGEEVATPLPEMHNISWINDLGFEDLSDLDRVKESEFTRVKSMCGSKFE